MNSRAILSSPLPLIFFFFFLVISTSTAQTPPIFRCSSQASCQALVDYVPVNATTFADIKTLFGIKNHRDILGANNLSLSTPTNSSVAAQQPIKIPFPCKCNNGTGISNKLPVYTVKPGDILDAIARSTFSNLLTYQQIATVNNIPNPNLIDVGQKLVIPLPCSCDDVDEMKVVHYGHVVQKGSTVGKIAGDYGTTDATLLRLNGLANANDLMANTVLHVPVRACTSMIRNTSLDSSLLVASGTYTFTANNCVQCNCNQANNWTLQCSPSPAGVKVSDWSKCPSMQCEGNSGLTLGNTSSSSCGSTICAYAGYTKDQTILTTPVVNSTCPTNGASNGATKISSQWLGWTGLLISVEFGLLSFGLL